MDVSLLVGDAEEGFEVENLSCGEAKDDVEDNSHGAIENQRRDCYLERQLSV